MLVLHFFPDNDVGVWREPDQERAARGAVHLDGAFAHLSGGMGDDLPDDLEHLNDAIGSALVVGPAA
jgi:hypothetical protein